MKKSICVILVILTVLSTLSLGISAADKEPVEPIGEPKVTNAKSAYLYNIENNKVIYSLAPDIPVYPASTVKIMTAIVALEALSGRMNETVTVTAEMLADVSGNNIGLDVGEIVSIEDMFGAMIVNGANDAAYVLAVTAAGSTAEFVRKMNAKATEIGANQTRYVNPTGLHDENMVTTARDTCTIAAYAYNIPQFMDISSLLKYNIDKTNMNSERTVYNRNCLLSLYYEQEYYYDKARGLNAGSTYEGGYCVVTSARSGDLTYIAVVLDAESIDGTIYSFVNARNMLDWAFESYNYVDVLSPEQTVCEVPVSLALGIDHVTLVSGDTLSVYLPADADLETEITLSWTTDTEELQAPVKKNDKVGRVTAMYKGDPIGTADLIATADIERSDWLFSLYKIREFVGSTFFVAVLVSAVIFTVIYILGKAVWLKKKSKTRYK